MDEIEYLKGSIAALTTAMQLVMALPEHQSPDVLREAIRRLKDNFARENALTMTPSRFSGWSDGMDALAQPLMVQPSDT